MKHIYSIAFLIIFILKLQAQDVIFKASAPTTVATGSQFRVTYSVNAKPSSFKNPTFENFEVLSGPNTSSSTSISFVNGQMSQEISYAYSFILMASKEGKFTIQPAEIIVNGKTYKSNSLTIEVVKGNVPPTANNQQPAQGYEQNTPTATVSGEDVFIRVHVNKNNIYQGEQFIASIYIYTRLNIVGFEDLKFPTMSGFWSEDLENPNQIQLRQEYVNGQLYNVGLLKRVILSPNRSGTLTIDPVQATVVVQQKVQSRRRSIFDDFFATYQNVSKKLVSLPVTIQVKPLPDNKPEPFSGGVGTFQLETKVDNTQLKTNEAFTYTIKLNGNGNIKLVEIPKPKFPTDFEVYEPKTTENIHIKDGTTQGNKTLSYIIIPRHHGQFTIPGIVFNYFDLKSKTYKTIQTDDIAIQVSKDSVMTSATVISEFAKKDISVLGTDIRYVKTNIEPVHPIEHLIFSNVAYKISYPITLLALLTLLYIRKEQIKQRANIMALRNKKASRTANKRLKQSHKYLKEQNASKFYEEISRALWGYLSDKLMIPTSDLNKETATVKLMQLNVPQSIIDETFNHIELIEFARYAPSSITVSLNEIYDKTCYYIDELEKYV
ncbi:MAG: BatD family protein [Bacteroidales bacterium]|nr:BatD family protein [Bacteroidales bacterium]